MPDEQGSKGLLAFFASHPGLSLSASLASIVSIPLAIFLYFSGARSRELKFYVNPATTTIVKSGQSSDIHVLFKNEPVSTDVTALQVAIWNAGKEPIHAENVLDPIALKTSAPILEARIRHISRQTTHFAIDTAQQSQGLLGLSWKILENDDGAVVQLIIAGNASPVTVSGTIEGQRQIGAMKSRREMYISALAILFSLLANAAVALVTRSRYRGHWRVVYGVSALVIAAVMVLMLTSVWFHTSPEIPLPFD